MRNSQKTLEIAQENGSVVRVDHSTCLDFVYFQDILRRSRRPDDNITHRINKIDSADPKQCQQLYDMMQNLHSQRAQSLSFCMGVVRERIEGLKNEPEIKLNKKELSWMESEMIVEEIIVDRTMTAIKSKCKNL